MQLAASAGEERWDLPWVPQGAGNKAALWSREGDGEATDGAGEVCDTGLLKICRSFGFQKLWLCVWGR